MRHVLVAALLLVAATLVTVLAQTGLLPLLGSERANAAAATMQVSQIVRSRSAVVSNTAQTYNDTLSGAQVSRHQDGDTIIVLNADGDLRGTLTLKVHRDEAGSQIVGGECAFDVSYTQVTQISDPPPGGEDHSEALIQRGMLKGVVSGGQVTLSDNGQVTAIDSIQLTINGGTIEFENVTGGSATAQVTNLVDAANAAGSLTLNF
ncbi:MAG: hypothetical protein JO314_05045 [Acidobacteria bacterium]|nr:hypothetical protein [Acidobacteriota bacterium]